MIQSDSIRNRSVSDIVTSFDLHEVQSRLPESVPCRKRPVHVASEIPTSAEEPEAETVARIAMERASNRVERKYGFACSSAMDQLDRIERRVAEFEGAEQAHVTCLSIT